MSHLEMTKEEVANTMMVYNKVRKGGPKDKRIRRVELMGEHTPKPLHWIKVTQSLSDPLVPIDNVIADLQSKFGDIGDGYRPIVVGGTTEREFCIIGFFRKSHALEAAKTAAQNNGEMELCGYSMALEMAKAWFVDLYPRPRVAKLTDYKKICILQDP